MALTNAQQIAAIKSQALANIAAITATPKPSYSIDGQSVSWGEYLKQLQDTVSWCDAQLAAEAPVEAYSQGVTGCVEW